MCTDRSLACRDDAAAPIDAPMRQTTFGGARPVTLQVPTDFDATRSYPLLIILHGYGANAFLQQGYFKLNDAATTRQMFILAPDGTLAEAPEPWAVDPSPIETPLGRTPGDKPFYLGGIDVLVGGRVFSPERRPQSRLEVQVEVGRLQRAARRRATQVPVQVKLHAFGFGQQRADAAQVVERRGQQAGAVHALAQHALPGRTECDGDRDVLAPQHGEENHEGADPRRHPARLHARWCARGARG